MQSQMPEIINWLRQLAKKWQRFWSWGIVECALDIFRLACSKKIKKNILSFVQLCLLSFFWKLEIRKKLGTRKENEQQFIKKNNSSLWDNQRKTKKKVEIFKIEHLSCLRKNISIVLKVFDGFNVSANSWFLLLSP